jgi:hypothetical protein
MHTFFSRKFTKSRAQAPRGPDAPVPFRSTQQYQDNIKLKQNKTKKAKHLGYDPLWPRR